MKYGDKSFSVALDISQERWDATFGKKSTASTSGTAADVLPAGEGAVSLEQAAPPAEAAPDYSQRQCAACLERGHVAPMMQDGEDVPGMLQCGVCLARFPLGVEVVAKFHGEAACTQCDGTGHLRTAYVVFGCATCGGTGARQK